MSVRDLITALELEPLGFEGGYYRESYRCPIPTEDGARSACTAIYYLLSHEGCSHLHRIPSDEMYHFYRGDPVEMLLLYPDGHHELHRLGPAVEAGEVPQLRVPAGVWQGARVIDGGDHALFGVTVSPGFELADFQLGRRSALIERYPEAADTILALTAELLQTPDLEITPATASLLNAELQGKAALQKGLDTVVSDAWPPEGHDPQALLNAEGDSWYLIHRAGHRLVGFYTRTEGGEQLRWAGVGGDLSALRHQVHGAIKGR